MKIQDIDQLTVPDLATGRKMLEAINMQITGKVNEMQRAEDNDTWKLLSDEKYELVKVRRQIQNEMGKVVKASMNYEC